MKSIGLLLLLLASSGHASGPVAPDGWDGSFVPRLPNGAACCLPADLNGTELVGGAFVLLSSDGKEFGLFALTYTPPLKEHWQLLERHPVSALESFRFSLVSPGQYPHGAIQACTASDVCRTYFTQGPGVPVRRASRSFNPNPLRGSA